MIVFIFIFSPNHESSSPVASILGRTNCDAEKFLFCLSLLWSKIVYFWLWLLQLLEIVIFITVWRLLFMVKQESVLCVQLLQNAVSTIHNVNGVMLISCLTLEGLTIYLRWPNFFFCSVIKLKGQSTNFGFLTASKQLIISFIAWFCF